MRRVRCPRSLYSAGSASGSSRQIGLPFDRPRPAVSSYRGGRVELRLGGGCTLAFAACAWGRGEPVHGLQAGLAALADAAWCGERHCDRQPDRGSHGQRAGRSCGVFVNTLVLRTDTSGNPSLRELIGRVRASNLLAYSHQDVPFERLLSAQPCRARCRTIHCSR